MDGKDSNTPTTTSRAVPARLVPQGGSSATGKERVVLTPEHIETLCQLKAESGMGPQAMLRGAYDKPPGLNARMVTSWIEGKAKTADPDHLHYVLSRWHDVPDRSELRADLHPGVLRRQRYRRPRIALTEERLAFLKAERVRTGIGPTRLLKFADDVPHGLNANMLTNWLMGQNSKVREDHYAYVLDLWASLPDA